jgi:hypothetical protein
LIDDEEEPLTVANSNFNGQEAARPGNWVGM